MSGLGVVSVVLGILLIATRGPLIFMPEASTRFYRKVLRKEMLVRILGLFTAVLSLAMIAGAWGEEKSGAQIVMVLGWILAVAALCEMLFPSVVQAIMDVFLDANSAVARVVGVIAVALGFLFVCMGFFFF